MWRSLALPALGVVLMAGGCSSPLNEYVCESDSDCTSGLNIGLSRCESSGHCSVLDPSCTDTGFRFGEGAGRESGECVGAASDTADAGTGRNVPVASIALDELSPCRTNLLIDGSESEAFDGATLTNFSWTLRDEQGAMIDSFEGAPEQRLDRGTHRVGGTLLRPNVNFPDYHGASAFQAGIDGVLRTSVFQRNINLMPTAEGMLFRLFFSVGVEANQSLPGQDGGVVRLVAANGAVAFQAPFMLEPGRFVGHQFDLSTQDLLAAGNLLDKATLQFEFPGEGIRWLDNVAVVNLATGNTLSQNESAETSIALPWLIGDGDTDLNGLIARNITSALESDALYTLELQVTDSNGERSEVDTLTVFPSICP